MVRGGQFGEVRRRGSLIDDEEQLVRFVFAAARVSRYRCYRAPSAIVLSTRRCRVFYRGGE